MDFQLNLNSETVEHAYAVDALSLEPTVTVREAVRQMKSNETGAVLICEGGKLTGIFTERDALKLLAAKANLDEPLQKHMTADPISLSEKDTVGEAIAKMSYGGYRRLPIVDEKGCPTSVLMTSGILHYLVEHFPKVIYTLPPRPHHSTQHREGA